ncbi:MAG: FtsX-like permease family protein [Prevotella sp.]|jgi:putative ABC transport system permease protein|nr:FtsX-like permease family protein [Prevotella sp.]
MIKQIFKIIWIERKINIWILLELILVFCILWFCTDYLFFTAKRYFQPQGFDIEHTYRINISTKDEGKEILSADDEEAKKKMQEDIWTIYDRIKQYQAVEYVSYSNSAYPYSGSWSSTSVMQDSVKLNLQIKRITPEFFNVFKINIISGTPFTWENSITGRPVIISADKNDLFGKQNPEKVEFINRDKDNNENNDNVIGVANKSKRSEFEEYNAIGYYPMKKDDQNVARYREICIRVKPEADKNFPEQFTKDMRNQLEVGHYYLSSVTPIDEDRENYMGWTGYSDNFKSIYSISAFLIINIFLGIVGTFWFRVQSRRSEIGLRIAMGSTKGGVKRIFISETFSLLFLASLVATIICVNISIGDILKDINLPVPDRGEEKVEIVQHFINYGITLVFLALIAFFAVWYPASRAAKIQPAEALKDE